MHVRLVRDSGQHTLTEESAGGIRMIHFFRDLSWKKHSELNKDEIYAMLPIGAIEQHGPHMPVGTDDLIIEYVVRRLTKDERVKPEVYVLPPLHYGLSPEHMDLSGTITLRSSTIKAIVEDILSCLKQHGWKKLIILNSHGGNKPFLHGLAQEWKRHCGLDVYVVDTRHTIFNNYARSVLETAPELEVHAGEDETSQMLYEYPELVHMEELSAFSGRVERLPRRRDSWFTAEVDPNGIVGAPHLASGEKGEKLTGLILQCVIDQLNSLEELCD